MKKVDAIVTGILLGWIVASIYGIKKTNKYLDEQSKQEGETKMDWLKKILKMLIFGYNPPVIEKKKGFFSRLFKK